MQVMQEVARNDYCLQTRENQNRADLMGVRISLFSPTSQLCVCELRLVIVVNPYLLRWRRKDDDDRRIIDKDEMKKVGDTEKRSNEQSRRVGGAVAHARRLSFWAWRRFLN